MEFNFYNITTFAMTKNNFNHFITKAAKFIIISKTVKKSLRKTNQQTKGISSYVQYMIL